MKIDWMEDARKIPDEAMFYIRALAVNAVRELGRSPEEMAIVFNIHRTSMYDWLKQFDIGGIDSLKTRVAPGATAIITKDMDEWIKKTILESTPLAFGYDTNLWTCDILTGVIENFFGVIVSAGTVRLHLKEMNLTCQKPEYRDVKRDPIEIDKFLEDKFPRIRRLAANIGAEIAFEDEAGVGIMTRTGRTWGVAGETPIIPASVQRGGYNVLSVVTSSGELEYSIQEKSVNAEGFVKFLKQLLENRKQPLILLADRASFHKAKLVVEFVRENRKQLRIYFLPKRAPEFNPDEQVWNEIKNNRIGKQPIKDKFDLKVRLFFALEDLKADTKRVMSFFGMKNTKYAAAT